MSRIRSDARGRPVWNGGKWWWPEDRVVTMLRGAVIPSFLAGLAVGQWVAS